MLNPSAADGEQDDPTIRRCIGFARSHGFNAIEVVNLFAYRATDPRDLKRAGYPVGPLNDEHILHAASQAGAVCLAYGAHGRDLERVQVVLPQLRRAGSELQCLAISKDGVPRHPLMLRSDCRLHPFSHAAIEAAMAPLATSKARNLRD